MKMHCGVCPKCFKPVNQKLQRHHVAPRRFFRCGNHVVLFLCESCHQEIESILPRYRKLKFQEYWDITLLWLQGKQPKVL